MWLTAIWPTDWIVVVALCFQTVGSGLPVAAVALKARNPDVAIASTAGANRNAWIEDVDAD